MKYRNLDLEAFDYERTDDGAEQFRVRVADSPAGQQRLEKAAISPMPAGLRPQLQYLDQHSLSLTGLIRLGVMLADALFPPAVRALVERSRERLADDEGLRIRLRLDTYALADLPWEYTYLPQPGTPADYREQDGFLVLDRRISLVRYELLGQAPGSLDPVNADSLRMAVLMANPPLPGVPSLNLAAEEQHITQAIGELTDLHAQFYRNATLDMLQDALVRETHIFHFAGHGTFDLAQAGASGGMAGKGYLLFMDESGGVVYLPAEKLAANLRGRGVRLAVLGACLSSRRDNANPWTGIAPALTRAGIPAVIGMQYTIDDANAIAFSKRLYRALVAGQPIDAAVSDGRLAIFNRPTGSEQDWGAAALYLRAEEGVLFPQPAGGTFPPAGPRPASAENGSLSRLAGATGTGDGRLVIAPPSSVVVDKRALREAIIKNFGPIDLDLLCADVEQDLANDGVDLQVNTAVVGGSSLPAQVLNLIQYLDRRGYLDYLVKAVRRARPGII